MKQFLILLLTLIPYLGICQPASKMEIYLNANKTDLHNVFINKDQIDTVIFKHDKLFIATKEVPWKYKTLNQLLNYSAGFLVTQIYDKSVFPIFIINGSVLKDMEDIRIDNSYWAKVTLTKLSDVKGVEKCCRSLLLVDIDLLQNVYIRGKGKADIDSLMKLK